MFANGNENENFDRCKFQIFSVKISSKGKSETKRKTVNFAKLLA